MRTILLILLFSALSALVAAQPPVKVVVRAAGAGKISVARGKTRAVVDLKEETAGCVYASGAGKRASDRRGCTASPAKYRLIDAVRKDEETFLVVMSEAAGNCNVCGQCGASDSYALIWLRLDARLRVRQKTGVPIEYCLANTTLVSPASSEADYLNGAGPKMPFEGDLLRVEFERTEFGAGDARIHYYSTLEYNRKTPEKGFVIKTERRDKSATDGQ